MDPDSLLVRVFNVIPLVLSLTVHEFAHAATAVHFGDDTPVRQGRYTLNPIPHIDPIGTLLLPLLGVPFGWAKPVQWNPARIRRDISMKRALWMVSIAGPASNLALAFIAAIAFFLARGQSPAIDIILGQFFGTNVALAVFNMLPIPPLDGSRIVDATIPRSMEDAWAGVHRFAPFLLFGIILIPPVREGLGSLIALVSGLVELVALRITGG